MSKTLRITAGTLTAGLVLAVPAIDASATAAAPTQPADVAAKSCSHSWSNKDSGQGYVDADWLMRRSGPHTTCNALGQAVDGTKIYYHCFVGHYPNSWTHGRIAGTNQNGWFFDKYLDDHGSSKRC